MDHRDDYEIDYYCTGCGLCYECHCYVEPKCWDDVLQEIKNLKEAHLQFQHRIKFTEEVVPQIYKRARKFRKRREPKWYHPSYYY